MNQQDAITKKNTGIQDQVRTCELRMERGSIDARGNERIEYVCGASGGTEHGYVLGVAGEDSAAMRAICNACPIPDALESRRACLNLVPVRRFGVRSLPVIQPGAQGSQSGETVAEVYFTCRWFYKLYREKQPRNNSMCLGCPYWFPRPPVELIPRYWPETQRMLRIVNGEEKVASALTGFTISPQRPSEGAWWQRLLRKIHF
ncbi:MAG TPA: hypothetical protein VNE38_05225 [Ktedonobacteraceae bacterium]|nr:hypothetical protein [Ktedonobacteraceae bacterium]